MELLPCPFCGGTKLRVHKDFLNGKVLGCWLFCENDNCNAEGPWDLGESGAIEKWNERVVINEN